MRILLTLILITSTLFASGWKQTSGPEGANFTTITLDGEQIFAVSYVGHIFYYDGVEWTRQGRVDYSDQLEYFNEILFAGSDEGLKRSDDLGTTWTDNIISGDCTMLFEKENKLYTVISDTLYVSEDGINWENPLVGTTANTMLFGEPTLQDLIDFESVGITDSTYAIGCETSVYPLPRGMYVTSDNGENWVIAQGISDPSYVYGIVNYDGYLVANTNNNVYRSFDGGFNWTIFNNGLPTSDFQYISTRNLELDNDRLYLYNQIDEKYYTLQDTTWQEVMLLEGGYRAKIKNGTIYTYSGDGITLTDIDNGSSQIINNGLIATNSTVYSISENIVISKTNNASYKTVDAGINWETYPFNNYEYVSNNGIVLAASEHGIVKSTDMGTTWQNASTGIPSSYKNSVRRLFCDENNGYIYAAFHRMRARTHLPPVWEAGGVYRSTNNGDSWQAISNGLPSEGSVKVPIYHFYASGNALVIRSYEGIYRSTNGGANWSHFEDGLNNSYVSNFASSGSMVFAGAYRDVLFYDELSTQWNLINDGLPEVDYTDAFYQTFIEYNNSLYIYIRLNEENYFYKFVDGQWVEKASHFFNDFRFVSFSVSSNRLYASVQEAGVWYTDNLDDVMMQQTVQYSEGWNLVSVPYNNPANNVSSVFPNASSDAFAFDNGYSSTEDLSSGIGYWLKFDSQQSVLMQGYQSSKSIQLNEGWNIIGPFENAVSVSSITTVPSSIIASEFFCFNNGYQVTTTLEPGKGYWVNASQDGTISLDESLRKPQEENKFDKTASLTILDAKGNGTQLYFGKQNTEHSLMPPLPPNGVFDARFADNTFITRTESENRIKLTGAEYPVTISAKGSNIYVNGSLVEDGSSISIARGSGSISVKSVNSMPENFELSQNYPNPFNPATDISFTLPQSSKVIFNVYNTLGELVSTFENNYDAGVHKYHFNGNNLSSGIYIYTLSANSENGSNFTSTKKMLLLK